MATFNYLSHGITHRISEVLLNINGSFQAVLAHVRKASRAVSDRTVTEGLLVASAGSFPEMSVEPGSAFMADGAYHTFERIEFDLVDTAPNAVSYIFFTEQGDLAQDAQVPASGLALACATVDGTGTGLVSLRDMRSLVTRTAGAEFREADTQDAMLTLRQRRPNSLILQLFGGSVGGEALSVDTDGNVAFAGVATGDGSGLGELDADALSTGTVSYDRLPATVERQANKGVAGGYAGLDEAGKIPTSYLPALAITDTYVVASQAAMLALTAERGDVAVRTDLNKSFILKVDGAGTLANWQELVTPTDSVLSVNGQTGAVTLTSTHVTEGTNLYWTNARFDTRFDPRFNSMLAAASSTSNLAGMLVARDANGDFAARYVTVASPTTDNHAANRAFVLQVAGGLIPKESVAVATTANITLAGTLTLDGYATSAGQRALVKNQTDATQNGVYVVSAGAWTRAADADTNAEVFPGMNTLVVNGATQGGTNWTLVTTGTITLGTTPLTFSQTTAQTTISAGNGMTQTDNHFDVVAANPTIVVNSDSIQVGVLQDANHGNLSGGALHAVATPTVAGFMSAADKTSLNALVAAPVGVTSFNTRTGAVSLLLADVTGALGFTPQNAAAKGAANGYPSLDGSGKIPESQLPALAITDTYVVASQAAMLALTAQRGDVAVRTDEEKSYILATDGASTLANWTRLRSPADGVVSVNSQTGAVVLTAANVGALPIGGGTLTGKVITLTPSAGGAGFNLPHGVVPTTPVNGDVWTTTAGAYVRVNSVSILLANAAALSATALTSGTVPEARLTLADVGVKGIVTAGANLAVTAGVMSLSSGGVTGALGFTPENAANKGAASGYAPLDSSSKIPTSYLPALAITDTFVVANQAAMLALTAERGDIAVRSDLNKTFILKTDGASTLANWQELLTPTDTVLSVNGQTGAVTLTSSNVTEGTNLYYTNTRADARITAALASTTPAALGVAAAGDGTTLARANHVHPMPSAADVGAAAAVHNHDSAYLAVALKGASNGLAELDAGGLVPLDQLPEMAGGATNYATLAALKAVSVMADDDQALLEGFGLYRYDAASTELDDDELVVKPTSVGTGAGRWLMESVNPDGVLAYTEPEFSAIWDVLGPVKGMLMGTITHDFSSLAAAAGADLYVTVEGAVPGSPVFVGPPANWPSTLLYTAVVVADHTVRLTVRNHTSGAIDPAAGTWTFTVFTA